MTKKDFFRVLIKLLGLYWLLKIFNSLLTLFNYLFYQSSLAGAVGVVIVIIVSYLIIKFLILKPDVIIQLLNLDKGFDDERMDFKNFNIIGIIQLAIIFTGGYLFIINLPSFIKYTITAFQDAVSSDIGREINNNYKMFWLVSTLKIGVGYLLIANYTSIGKYIKKLGEKNNPQDNSE